jgi:hypothetical protein
MGRVWPRHGHCGRRSTRSLASMQKRTQSKKASAAKVKRTTSAKQSTSGKRSAKVKRNTGASSAVTAAFKRTTARIREIEMLALLKLRGKDDAK